MISPRPYSRLPGKSGYNEGEQVSLLPPRDPDI
jgi:hypothetical protein